MSMSQRDTMERMILISLQSEKDYSEVVVGMLSSCPVNVYIGIFLEPNSIPWGEYYCSTMRTTLVLMTRHIVKLAGNDLIWNALESTASSF